MSPNNALHSDAPRPAGSGFPRSLRSLGAGERGRYASHFILLKSTAKKVILHT